MKKTLVLFLAMMAVFAFGVCAIELDTAENAAEAVAAEEAAVLAADELKPGLNIWTGTTEAYTFDDETLEGFSLTKSLIDTYPEVVTKEMTEGDGNKALELGARFESIAYTNFPTIDKDRPLKIKLDVFYTGQVRAIADSELGDEVYNVKELADGATEKYEQADIMVIYGKTNSAWTSLSYDVKGSQTTSAGTGDYYNAPWEGSDIENFIIYMYSKGSGTNEYLAAPSYIDNVSIIPYYQLSYDVNGGTGAEFSSVYFYAEDGAPYTAVADGSALTKDGLAFAGWALTPDATPNDIIDKLYPVPGSDVTLYAVYGEAEKAELKPGLNLFTGTENALTFEGDEKYLSKFLTNGAVVETNAHGDDTDNKVLKFTAGDQYFAVRYFPETEADRPFDVKLDVNYNAQVRIMDNDVYDSALETKADAVVIYATSNGWKDDRHYTIKGTQTTSQGTSGHYTADYYGDAFKNLFVYSYNNVTRIDNLNITPYYKITYDANGGTGSAQADEYFYVASTASYTLKNTTNDLVKGDLPFAGWALTPEATVNDIVTSIKPTLGEDVTLYAVYGTPITVTLMKDDAVYSTINTVAGKKTNINETYFADAENFYVNWQTEDKTSAYIGSSVFYEDTVLYANKVSRKLTIGENAIANGDFEGTGIDVKASAGNLYVVEDDAEHGKVLKYVRAGGYSSIQHGVIWETGRKYRIEYDAKLPEVVSNHFNTVYAGADHGKTGTKAVANEWVHTDYDYMHTDASEALTGDMLTFYINPVSSGVENVVYYDNLKLIPYHKVTFDANGATGTAPEADWTLDAEYVIEAGAGEMIMDGYYLAGWATSADGEPVDKVATVKGEDITLYAVWKSVADENAPTSDTESFSLRAGEKAGMRLYASVTELQRNASVEYGFIAARADVLESLGYNAAELNLGLTYNGMGEGSLFVKGEAYKVVDGETTVDKYLENTDEGDYIFAAVCTGLDATDKKQVTTQFVVRPYINIGGVYAYGKPIVKSLYEVAKAADTTTLPESVITYIETIIATAEAADAE